jgi:Mg2+-importing ATPase
MAVEVRRTESPPANAWRALQLRSAATMSPAGVLGALASEENGLSPAEARRRLQQVGPNALRSHGARPLAVLLRQLRNPLLILLVAAALTRSASSVTSGSL